MKLFVFVLILSVTDLACDSGLETDKTASENNIDIGQLQELLAEYMRENFTNMKSYQPFAILNIVAYTNHDALRENLHLLKENYDYYIEQQQKSGLSDSEYYERRLKETEILIQELENQLGETITVESYTFDHTFIGKTPMGDLYTYETKWKIDADFKELKLLSGM